MISWRKDTNMEDSLKNRPKILLKIEKKKTTNIDFKNLRQKIQDVIYSYPFDCTQRRIDFNF